MLRSNSHHKPLKNSSGANSPFRSPFRNINGDPAILSTSPAPLKPSKSSLPDTPKSAVKRENVSKEKEPGKIKRKRLNIAETPKSDAKTDVKNDLMLLKKSIRNKKMEIDNLKLKLTYRKMHNKEDLEKEISKWRSACHEALIQYQKDLKERSGEDFSIDTILTKLNISKEHVEFPEDY